MVNNEGFFHFCNGGLRSTYSTSIVSANSSMPVVRLNSNSSHITLSNAKLINEAEGSFNINRFGSGHSVCSFGRHHSSGIYSSGRTYSMGYSFSTGDRSTKIVFFNDTLYLKFRSGSTIFLGGVLVKRDIAFDAIDSLKNETMSKSFGIHSKFMLFAYDKDLVYSKLSKYGATNFNRFLGVIKKERLDILDVKNYHSNMVTGIVLKARSVSKLRSLKRKIIKESLHGL